QVTPLRMPRLLAKAWLHTWSWQPGLLRSNRALLSNERYAKGDLTMTMPRLTTLNISNPVGQAFWAMRVIFTVAPILFGLDKFFNLLVDWPRYLAPWIPAVLHVSPQVFMYGVGIVEIAAGILVGLWPHLFAYVIVAWLWGIILNLLTIPGYFDIALRDFGL